MFGMQAALKTDSVSMPSPPKEHAPADCEVLFMIGLPGIIFQYQYDSVLIFSAAWQTFTSSRQLSCRLWQDYLGNKICCQPSREALRFAQH